MKKINLVRQTDGFSIYGPMETTGGAAAPAPVVSIPSEQGLRRRLQAYDFTEEVIEDAIKKVKETGDEELVLG